MRRTRSLLALVVLSLSAFSSQTTDLVVGAAAQGFHFHFGAGDGGHQRFHRQQHFHQHFGRAPSSNRGDNDELYKTLGVPRDASPKSIRSAYHKLAREKHPDKVPAEPGSDEAAKSAEEFKKLTNAYEVLSDEEKRREYDLNGDISGNQPAQNRQRSPYGHHFGDPFEGFFHSRGNSRVQRDVDFGRKSILVGNNFDEEIAKVRRWEDVQNARFDRANSEREVPFVVLFFSFRMHNLEELVSEVWRTLTPVLRDADVAYFGHSDVDRTWLGRHLGVRSVPSVVCHTRSSGWSSPIYLSDHTSPRALFHTLRNFLPLELDEEIQVEAATSALRPLRTLAAYEAWVRGCSDRRSRFLVLAERGVDSEYADSALGWGMLSMSLAARHSACVASVLPSEAERELALKLRRLKLQPGSITAFEDGNATSEGLPTASRVLTSREGSQKIASAMFNFAMKHRHARHPSLAWHNFEDICGKRGCFVLTGGPGAVISDTSRARVYKILRQVEKEVDTETPRRSNERPITYIIPESANNVEFAAAFGIEDATVKIVWLKLPTLASAVVSALESDETLSDFARDALTGKGSLSSPIPKGIARRPTQLREKYFRRPAPVSLWSAPLPVLRQSIFRIWQRFGPLAGRILGEGLFLPLLISLWFCVSCCRAGNSNQSAREPESALARALQILFEQPTVEDAGPWFTFIVTPARAATHHRVFDLLPTLRGLLRQTGISFFSIPVGYHAGVRNLFDYIFTDTQIQDVSEGRDTRAFVLVLRPRSEPTGQRGVEAVAAALDPSDPLACASWIRDANDGKLPAKKLKFN